MVRHAFQSDRGRRSVLLWSGCDRGLAAILTTVTAAVFALGVVDTTASFGDDAPKMRQFTLRLVGPEGKPAPGVEVQIRRVKALTREQVLEGEFLRGARYGTFCRTTDQGVLAIRFPAKHPYLGISIVSPGYGPYWAQWEKIIPDELTAELDAAWTVGGVIVDEEGNPVEGAKVHPSLEFKKRPGNEFQLAIGDSATTDAQGRWKFESVPESLAEVSVAINHKDFRPLRMNLNRADYGVEGNQDPARTLTLDRGLIVVGRVTDDVGQPIAGAVVKTEFVNEEREATTDDNGEYMLSGCDAARVRVVVHAPGKALTRKEVDVAEGMKPVDFQMAPGGHVRIRIVDHEGKPVPKTRVFFQRWGGDRINYFEFDHVDQYANADGIWEWNEAPLDGFHADIAPPAGVQLSERPFEPRAEEYLVKLYPPLIIRGNVVDAETRKPIPEFKVVPGLVFNGDNVYWNRGDAIEARNGRYEIRPDRSDILHTFRIEATNYRAAVARHIQADEGSVTIDLELEAATDVFGKVVTDKIEAAEGAIVALGVPGSHIQIVNGSIRDNSTNCARETTDEEGTFRFPPPETEYELVITHPLGSAHVKSEDQRTRKIIVLTPWASVRGVYRVGATPQAGTPLDLDTLYWDATRSDDGPHISASQRMTTDENGRFEFTRAFPGRCYLRRPIHFLVNEGAREVASSKARVLELESGAGIEVNLGGTGRPVIAQLLPPQGADDDYRWSLASVTLRPANTDDLVDYFTASVDKTGLLRIDDVDPGEYVLSIHMIDAQPGQLRAHAVTVPDEESTDPVDLREIQLQ